MLYAMQNQLLFPFRITRIDYAIDAQISHEYQIKLNFCITKNCYAKQTVKDY